MQADQLLREHLYPIGVSAGPSKVHPHVASNSPTQVRKRLSERRDESLPIRIGFVVRHERADAPYAVGLLPLRHHRRHRRAPNPRDECSSFH